jgi:hypothetical protein
MAYTIIRGKAVSGADTYKLYKIQGSSYEEKATSSRLHFDLLALGASDGDYVVKAFGKGYQASNYSNLVSYTKPATEEIPDTPIVPDTPVTPDPDPETPTEGTCVITFNIQGHGEQPEQMTIKTPGTLSDLPVLVAEGYTFGGWWLEPACSELAAEGRGINVKVTSLILYAKWTANAPASGDEDDTETGGSGTLPTPTIYTVRSWLTNCHFETNNAPPAGVPAESQLATTFSLDDNCVWGHDYVKVLMGGEKVKQIGLIGEATANPYYLLNISSVTGNVEIYAFAVPKVEVPENFAGTWVFKEEISEDFIPWNTNIPSGSLDLNGCPIESIGKKISLITRLVWNVADTLNYHPVEGINNEIPVYDFKNKKWLIEGARTFTISEDSAKNLTDVQKMLIAGNATKQA